MPKEEANSLHKVVDVIPENQRLNLNKKKAWKRGYNKEHDIVVISKDGTVGEVYEIQGLWIALPEAPKNVHKRSKKAEEQYWEKFDYPKSLQKVKSIFAWNEMSVTFRAQWEPYIDEEFDRRENGFWFMNDGEPTYITGSQYFYLQWAKIDVGYADFREANRILYIFWEACMADKRSFGMDYLKIRRSGASYMGAGESINIGTLTKESHVGMMSKTGKDSKSLFTDKVVPMNSNLPFFFKPIMSGSDRPKTQLEYAIPASRISKKSMAVDDDNLEALNTTISWKSTENNAYDGQKLKYLVMDETGKWLRPSDLLEAWRVHKTCLVLGAKIIGKCWMCSTCNALDKGGQEFKDMYFDSNVLNRSSNGRTKSGLYALFIPMEYNLEGFIDRHGRPVVIDPEKPVMGVDGEMIDQGAVSWWEAEVDALKSDPDALNEFYRQFPRTEAHAFRDESNNSLFDLEKIYYHIDINDAKMAHREVTRGNFAWVGGKIDGAVEFYPDKKGRFRISWIPNKNLRNKKIDKNGVWYPANEHLGAFGCDSYDISGTVDGSGSNGALHGLTAFHMDDAPVNQFFLEYIARPKTAEIFYEDVLMAIVFYGMPILAENNKPRLLYHLKNRGYRGYSMNRPDKPAHKLSVTERELGGIPNSSEDIKIAHASAIDSYIKTYLGEKEEEMFMPFNETLNDWARFDITKRTKHDASISSGLAIMGCQRHLYHPTREKKKLTVKFPRYNNRGHLSRLLDN